MMRRALFGALAVTIVVASIGPVIVTGQNSESLDANVDPIFAKWTNTTPGCAVGASKNGEIALLKAYGLADLERDVRITPDTIFEAGSVSKQFTAAAVLLLAKDGKLSLDDPVRKYIPELPDYGAPLTIRHMLNHTSGLRDWGAVAAIGGWPRTSRVYTQAHMLDVTARQSALNFPPGTRWSYTNTGYNLAAMIVARVSGLSFADFTQVRIFAPLGMTRTSWRDDHTRLVKGRALAYLDAADGYHTQMPFENVHGNGGLLTTVADLLKWNENFFSPRVGDAAFVRELQEPGRFSDGRTHGYALGLFVGSYKGLREVSHGGATAGYRANVVRYPDEHVSVAVLCNVSSMPSTYAHSVADLLLHSQVENAVPATPYKLTEADVSRVTGLYRNTSTGVPASLSLSREEGELRLDPGGTLLAVSGSHFVTPSGLQLNFDGDGRARATDAFGTVDRFERVSPAAPTHEQLQALAGTYVSDEAEGTYSVAVDRTALVLKRRPDTTIRLRPVYEDAFEGPRIGLLIFRRGATGQVAGFSVVQDRVWDLRFTRLDER